ncbi:MAG: arylsulfatase [Candidatus Hydrogenedentota bacterium]
MSRPTRRTFLRNLGLGAGVLAAACRHQPGEVSVPEAPADTPWERPNVVVILTDDQGYGDVGVHGNDQIQTPHLDRFARDGIDLTRFYCSPVCAPTRASLMTGRYYYRTGVIHTWRGGAKMHADETTLAEMLRAKGYATGLFGKWHLGDNYPMRPQDQGFDTCLWHKSGGIGQVPDKPNSYLNPKLWRNGEAVQAQGYCTDVFFEAAREFIAANRNRPFFAYLPTNAPHTPLEIGPEYIEPYTAKGIDETTARVYGMISNIDDNVGRLLDWLDQQGLRENTLVIFLGDNGPQQERYTAGLRGRKTGVYEGGIRVPCFVQWPTVLEGKRRLDAMTAHIDLTPTILEACKTAPLDKAALDGISLLPLLLGAVKEPPERHLFFQCHRGLFPERYHNAAVVTNRYKLVCNPGTFGQEKLAPGKPHIFELYDLENDPGEQTNRAATYPEVVAALKKAYDAWYHDVQGTRGFAPGRIHLGSPYENPVRLCRNQDQSFWDGKPRGWPVHVERGGLYELTIERGESTARGTLHVAIQGNETVTVLAEGEHAAVVALPEGEGMLRVWVQEPGKVPEVHLGNDTIGDVTARFLE